MQTPMPDYGINFNTSVDIVESLTPEQIAARFIKDKTSGNNYEHHVKEAQLFAVAKDNSFAWLSSSEDVYQLLEQSSVLNLSSYSGVLVYTTGWAAPLQSDGSVGVSPSQHSERRRIALAACVNDTSAGSAISFADTKEVVTDPGSATGSLADALMKFWKSVSEPF